MKTGNTMYVTIDQDVFADASMEPGHEDREYLKIRFPGCVVMKPQWSPVMKTGNTRAAQKLAKQWREPQWSPVMKTGNTRK